MAQNWNWKRSCSARARALPTSTGSPTTLVVPVGQDIEGGLEPILHEGDGQVGDVYADPTLRLSLCAAAIAVPQPQKGSKHNVTLVGGGLR